MSFTADPNRYQRMLYRRCGRSGLKLPEISLGLYQKFGAAADFGGCRQLICRAFDLGITHFDLANNYGPPPGSAEITFGQILWSELSSYRDELVISTKAGYDMWAGPYGEWGSRKHLLASLDQSLKRMSLDYVDIFYSHRPDPETPLEETMAALHHAVRSGKALYVGLSNYDVAATEQAIGILKALGTPCLVHQTSYSMFNRKIESGLLDLLAREGVGVVAFQPLQRGALTEAFLGGIPPERAAELASFGLTEERLRKVRRLRSVARGRGQLLSQMALTWVLRQRQITSALLGTSSMAHLLENVVAPGQLDFSEQELSEINEILEKQ
jgi:L-glyceraldehyde 3-phosphate reductase